MIYQNKFVAVVKSKGKVLRERDPGCVHLPFGSEYTLLLKNFSINRAVVEVEVDGKDALDGSSLVIAANDTLELKGFMRGGQGKKAFKFIQKTKEIAEHRGDRVEDGFIRITFSYEQPTTTWVTTSSPSATNYLLSYQPVHKSSPYRGQWSTTVPYVSTCFVANSLGDSNMKSSAPREEEGITVAGSDINQVFTDTTVGPVLPQDPIILRLFGEHKGTRVKKPLTVKAKVQCSTCGRQAKSSMKFCSNCGTALDW
jgi:hypothetical protein